MFDYTSVRLLWVWSRSSVDGAFVSCTPELQRCKEIKQHYENLRSVAQTYLRPKFGHDVRIFDILESNAWPPDMFQLEKYVVFHGEAESDLKHTCFFSPRV